MVAGSKWEDLEQLSQKHYIALFLIRGKGSQASGHTIFLSFF